MQLTSKGTLEIAEHEGIVLGPYRDSVGIWTVYVGHTAGAGGLIPATMPKENTRSWGEGRVHEEILIALRVFDEDLGKYETRVRKALKVSVLPYQFDALVSFDLNTGGIFKALLTGAINSGEANASRHFMGWLRPPEIRKRREAEKLLFETGDYDANGDRIPIYDALGDGRIRYRTAISGKELAKLMASVNARHVPSVPNPLAKFLTTLFKHIARMLK